MQISALYRHFITPILGAFFAFFGYVSFGEPSSFDKLFIGVLGVVFLYSIGKRDFNFTSLVMILLAWEVMTELVYLLNVNANIFFKLFFYFLLISPTFIFKSYIPKPFKIAVQVLIVWAILNELYWLTFDKQTHLYWEAFIFVGYVYISLLIFSRPFILECFNNGRGKATQIDFFIHLLMLVNAGISALSLIEYTARHSFNIPSMFIYNNYVVLMQSVALVALFVISRGYVAHVLDRLEA